MSFEIDQKVLDFLIEKNNVSFEDRESIRLNIQLDDKRIIEMIFCFIDIVDGKIKNISFTYPFPLDFYWNKQYRYYIISDGGKLFIDSGRIFKSHETYKKDRQPKTYYSKCKISLKK